MIALECQFESPFLVEPDGLPVEVSARAGALLHLVDPLKTMIRPVAFSHGGYNAWYGSVTRLAGRIPPSLGEEEEVRRKFDRLRDAANPPVEGLPGVFHIPPLWLEDKEGSTRKSAPTD